MDVNKEQEPNYWGIMGADVRYNDKLSSSQKIMYVEITALSNTKGYSWATNSYFARLYNVTTKTVSSWIKTLEKEGLIRIEYDWGKGKQVQQRRMYPVQMPPVGYAQKGVGGMEENVKGGMHKKVKENSINTNTINYQLYVEYWNECNKTNLRVTEGKRKQIRARLGKFTDTEIKSAIKARSESQWIKDNNQQNNWDALFRNDDSLEKWLVRASESQGEKDAWAEKGFSPVGIL